MKKKIFYFPQLILSLLIVLNCFTISAMDIYVSPNGNDSNPGTKKEPLQTLGKAKYLAYQNLSENSDSKVTVWIAEGTYTISNPMEFKPFAPENSNNILEFKAMKGSKPVISGGKELKGWKKNSEGLWEIDLTEMLKNGETIRELFINNKRAVRARFPKYEYLRVNKVGEDKRTNFFFNKDDFPIPQNLKGVELVLLHDWSISRIGVKEINSGKQQLMAEDSIGAKSPDFFNLDNWEPNPRYFLENAPEFIDENYDWVFLPDEKKIILKLPENENPNNLNIVVPISEGLIFLDGNESQALKNIHFEGITFRHSKWEIPKDGYCGVQACHFDPRPKNSGWSVVPAAVKAEWSENCSFSDCTFENLGGSGIWFGTACKTCTIENSIFTDVSGNGIMIGEGQDRNVKGENWWKSAPEQVALGNTIENCKVFDCGKQYYGAVGIWCGLTAETTIKNCEIYDLPYSGISIGWMWSPVPTPCRNNTIDGNHIHHIMQILSDGGGIYSLGLQPGSKLINNQIHDVQINAGRAESNGMFLDEGTTDVIVAGNLIYNIAKSPLRFHRATTNLVEGNYLFCKNENPPIRYNRTEENDIQKVDNKVFTELDTNYKKELSRAIKSWKVKE